MDNELLAALLAQRAPVKPRKGFFGHLWDACLGTLVVGVCLVAIVVGWEHINSAPVAPDGGTVNSVQHTLPTYAPPAPQPPRQQPIAAPAPLPDCATVQDTTTACQAEGELPDTMSGNSPTPTAAPPMPTPAGFWSQEEIAAFTATAEAFYNPETLPTVEPAFATAVQAGCEDAAKRAQSPLLDSWCKPLDE